MGGMRRSHANIACPPIDKAQIERVRGSSKLMAAVSFLLVVLAIQWWHHVVNAVSRDLLHRTRHKTTRRKKKREEEGRGEAAEDKL